MASVDSFIMAQSFSLMGLLCLPAALFAGLLVCSHIGSLFSPSHDPRAPDRVSLTSPRLLPVCVLGIGGPCEVFGRPRRVAWSVEGKVHHGTTMGNYSEEASLRVRGPDGVWQGAVRVGKDHADTGANPDRSSRVGVTPCTVVCIVAPVAVNGHHSLAVLDQNERVVYHFDSIEQPTRTADVSRERWAGLPT